jgi:hypothetical protein
MSVADEYKKDKKVACAMCGEIITVTRAHFNSVMEERGKRNPDKMKEFYCDKHLKMALIKYGDDN